MKPIVILFFMLCLTAAESRAQNAMIDSSHACNRDSIMLKISKTTEVVAITTLKVGGQVTCGFAGGILGAACLQFHPVTAGIGFIVGSSLCVYWIGDIANGRGQYQWVLAAGLANGIISVPIFLNNQHGGYFSGVDIAFSVMVTSVVSEIITFYATQKDSDPAVNVGMTVLPSQKNSYIPAVKFSVRL